MSALTRPLSKCQPKVLLVRKNCLGSLFRHRKIIIILSKNTLLIYHICTRVLRTSQKYNRRNKIADHHASTWYYISDYHAYTNRNHVVRDIQVTSKNNRQLSISGHDLIKLLQTKNKHTSLWPGRMNSNLTFIFTFSFCLTQTSQLNETIFYTLMDNNKGWKQFLDVLSSEDQWMGMRGKDLFALICLITSYTGHTGNTKEISGLIWYIVSVLGREEGYTVKYGLSPRECPRLQPKGNPEGSGLILPYISTWVLLRILSHS